MHTSQSIPFIICSTAGDMSDASMDSMVMSSQSCDLTAHVMVGNASQQPQQQHQQSVTMDTIEPVVDTETVEHMTQLSQQLSSFAIGKHYQCLIQLLILC